VVSLISGAALLVMFVHIEARAEEPILPLRILASRTRAAANAARGLGYAGMYGMVFFLTQFLQEIQHHSALVTGLGFLPTPIAVFLSSQFTSRVLAGRVPAKTLMLSGSALSATGLFLATRLHASTPYEQTLVSLVLIGAGMGISFVSLTTASLSGVAPGDAGAASGLINVGQQLGAALGLAVLVTVFESLTPGTFGAGPARGAVHQAQLVHGLDLTFAVAGALALAALSIVALFIRTPDQPEAVPAAELEMEAAA
jgi:predicted MFS family arabinose efflux permease